jgi:formylglycine-generating enzyme required for sulfatase activity
MRFRDLVISGLFGLSGLLAFGPADAQTLSPGNVFVDCEKICPQMVVIPAGSFMMGSPNPADEWAGPQRRVTMARPFAVGRFEITFNEWDACVTDGGCKTTPRPLSPADFQACVAREFCSNTPAVAAGLAAYDEGWGRGRRPVIHVNWHDARAYVAWLSRKTARSYRLLSEAEWEYVARVGPNGAAADTDVARGSGNFDRQLPRTLPVGAYAPNGLGLYDLRGNVAEWVEDCLIPKYNGAPVDGRAVSPSSGCKYRAARGGGWRYELRASRPSFRMQGDPLHRNWSVGFRVARDL